MLSKKDRRNSGRVQARSTIKAPKKEILQECLEPQEYWDDWHDYRDSFRNGSDRTKKRKPSMRYYDDWNIKQDNEKHKKLLQRRKAMAKK